MTKIDCLFAECNLFTKIDLSNFNTQEVTNMRNLFWKCENLLNINLSNILILEMLLIWPDYFLVVNP